MNSDAKKQNSALYKKIYNKANLDQAWNKVRSNGRQSSLRETQDKIRTFESKAEFNIKQIQKELRAQNYCFSSARGVLQKRKGKSPRPIVMASIKDRVVQRAILQVIQTQKSVTNILNTPYSFGGLKEKKVEDAINEIQIPIKSGYTHFIRSDIKQFFTTIDKEKVMSIFSSVIEAQDVLTLLQAALKTQLCKEDENRLGNDVALFPFILPPVKTTPKDRESPKP